MRDWSKPLRKAYFEALNNNVSIDVAPVGVFHKKIADHLPADYCIVIGSAQGSNDSTFSNFETDATIEVELIAQTQAELGDIVEDMADQVKNIVLPTRPGLHALPAQSGFQFTSVRLDGENDIPPIQGESKYITRKILRFRQRITDNN